MYISRETFLENDRRFCEAFGKKTLHRLPKSLERADKIVVLCLTCHGRCHNDLPKIGRDEIVQVLELALGEEI